MNPSQGLSLAACALGLYGVGQVWLVQVSSYRLWAYVGDREFSGYHAAWWRSIWLVILAPSALLFVCAALTPVWRAEGVPAEEAWAGLALQVALVLGTALWWAPLMARLETPDGRLSRERYRLMISTHWVRVAFVTAYGALATLMLAQSAWRL